MLPGAAGGNAPEVCVKTIHIHRQEIGPAWYVFELTIALFGAMCSCYERMVEGAKRVPPGNFLSPAICILVVFGDRTSRTVPHS